MTQEVLKRLRKKYEEIRDAMEFADGILLGLPADQVALIYARNVGILSGLDEINHIQVDNEEVREDG